MNKPGPQSSTLLSSPAHRPAYAARIRRVIEHMDANLAQTLSLEQLAAVAHFSPFHFHRQFSAFTGIPVSRLLRLMRLRLASRKLALEPDASITEIALLSGFDSPESFSRAFRQFYGKPPSAFREDPQWQPWQREPLHQHLENPMNTEVEIVAFPHTHIAAVEYQGPHWQSLSATRRLIAWRRENGVSPGKGQTFGIHYSDPENTPPELYRMDVAVSYDRPIASNSHGIVAKEIPAGLCARIRHLGSRDYIAEADYLYREWLPASGRELRDFPIFFHYVNVGPDVRDADMITDVYLPLKG
ncbi:MAG: AraC family transcriptional regulator [Pseudomonadales bacterium]|nr:AraC family transcriptional regulator [Pseudomonadales bacterium]